MSIEYSAEQIRGALLKAVTEGAPESVKEGLAALLAIHYPDEFETLSLVVALAGHMGDEA